MSRDQINTNNFTRDDYTGSFHKLSTTSRENSRFGPSLNPDLFVPNGDLGNIPDALRKYQPSSSEPSENTLFCAKSAANECEAIRQTLGPSWLGIDYTDPNCNYNCFCGPGLSTNGLFYDQSALSNPSGNPASLNTLPSDIANKNPSQAIYSQYDPACGTDFAKYLEYSKTNATFWNTPTKTPLYRRAQTSLLAYTRAKILVHGDFSVKPGQIIKIKFPVAGNSNIEKSKTDGPWMVYRVQHIMSGIKHSMYLYIMRDGNETKPKDGDTVEFGKTIL